jgi:MYXO-CTERM domain-containing protein
MKRTNGNRALLRAVALGQILLLVVAGCKSTSDKGSKAVVVNQALVGKDGAVTVTDPNMIVNDYAALATNAAVNDPSVTVASGGLSGLAAGDLVLIIQMAGATINEPNDASYGNVTDLGSAGNYELVGVTGFSANTITLGSNLHNSYTVAGKTQVVRVPQYSTLTINDGASIIAPPWNGTVGGVVALQAATTLDLSTSGKIDASATGFRGGATHTGLNFTTDSDQPSYRSVDPNEGAEKGESIAGDPNTLAFPYGRGAPANGGGGGNWHNAGGGGGANAAATGVGSDAAGPAWTGEGVMLNSVLGAAAWSLDPSYASSGGPGGGRGGYTYSSPTTDQDATTLAPGNATWGGNHRRERGGLGGHPLTSSPTGRLFLGGGGGAGDGNNASLGVTTGPGGRGGGLVFVIAGTVTGSGSILANGGDGGDSNSNGSVSGDASGGGGGGGSVVVHAGALGANVKVRANGGAGGNQININSNLEAEGPGGGGAGGYVALSGGTPTTVTADGRLGGTTSASTGFTSPLSEFPSNGATAGQDGLIDATAASSMHYYTNPIVTMATKPTDPTSVGVGTFSFTSAQSGVTFECNLDSLGYSSCPASYTTIDLTDGEHTLLVQGKDLNGNLSTTPASWTWHVLHAGDLDGGVDAEAEEAGAADVAALDVPPVIPEAGTTGLDAGEGLDGVVLLDAGEDSNGGSQDGPGTGLLDAAVRMDVAVVAADVPPVKLDASANGADTNGAEDTNGDGNELEVSAPQDAQGVVVVEPPSSDAAGAADQAVSPVLDAAGTTIADAAVPGPDAALPSLKAMGGGFCAVSPMPDSAPGLFTFFLVAAFGLLVLRRRR